MGPKVDLVPRLVLPLAGPTPDDLTEEEIEALPLDLQYLDDDKKVEEDLDIRTMLLETLNQLCATRYHFCKPGGFAKTTLFVMSGKGVS